MSAVALHQALQDRIGELEAELRARPTKAQVEWVREYADRREALYKAVLDRNEILVAENKRLKGRPA